MKSMFISTFLLALSGVSSFVVQPSSTVSRALFSTPETSSTPATPSTPAAPPARSPARPGPGPIETDQPKYGKSLELPGTYVRCGRCATSYAIAVSDLGDGKGRRVECALCSHSWFQTPERLFTLNDGHELIPLPQAEMDRINTNVQKGRDPDFIGNSKFYVGNLDFGVEESDLRDIFAKVGDVGAVSIVTGPDGRSRGFAFVTMMDDNMEEKCIALDGTEVKGRSINVKPPNN